MFFVKSNYFFWGGINNNNKIQRMHQNCYPKHALLKLLFKHITLFHLIYFRDQDTMSGIIFLT